MTFKKLNLESLEIPIGSGLGTVSTCISSSGNDTSGSLFFLLELDGMNIILHVIHTKSVP